MRAMKPKALPACCPQPALCGHAGIAGYPYIGAHYSRTRP